MNRTMLDLWVGFVVAIGVVALVFLALKVSNLGGVSFGESYVVTADFDNIGSLKVRAPVKSSGVVVGRVTSIDFDPTIYQARVSITLDGRYHFTKDTIAKILTSGLLGAQYIGLVVGGEEKMLQPGDNIAMTQSAVVVEELISQFMFNKASEGGVK